VFIGPHFSSLAYFVVIFKILPTLSTRGELTKEKRNHGTNLITAKLNGLTHTHNAKKETNIKEIKTNTRKIETKNQGHTHEKLENQIGNHI
jgi:hypothetical protein